MLKVKLYRTTHADSLKRQIDNLRWEISTANEMVKTIREGKSIKIDLDTIKSTPLLSELHGFSLKHEDVVFNESQRIWTNDGLLQLSEIFRNRANKSTESILDMALSFLVRHTGGNQGAIFILNDETPNDVFLQLTNSYAYHKKKYITRRIETSEGLVGQCYQEGSYIYLTDIPQQYVKITSGLGEATPTSIILVPLAINERKLGVFELAFFKPLKKIQIDFLIAAGESIGAFIRELKDSENTKKLLYLAESTASQLRTKESELRQNMEEMQTIQEELHHQNILLEKSKKELELRQLELERLKSEEAALLESKLATQEVIHQTIINRLKRKIEALSNPAEIIHFQ